MKITFKDYTTDKTVLTVPVIMAKICGHSVFIADLFNPTFNDEIEQAVCAINSGIYFDVLAENYSDSYRPINPYMTWSFEA